MRLPDDQHEAGWHIARKRVLLADNKIDGANSLALLLQLKGCDVRIANDGLEALRMAGAFAPDVVFIGWFRYNSLFAGDGLLQERHDRGFDCLWRKAEQGPRARSGNERPLSKTSESGRPLSSD